ncbi:MAG TPA: penicillin acylase family protein, partial [Edaphobacter sp.]
MTPNDRPSSEPVLITRRPDTARAPEPGGRKPFRSRILSVLAIAVPLLLIAALATFFAARHWAQEAMVDSLPQVDGSLHIDGLSSPVIIQRDAHGVPHIHANSLDDLIFA